jgi:hypothetical protein
MPTPPSFVEDRPAPTIPVGAWVLLVAAIATVLGALLPWARVGVTFGDEGISANISGTEGDGVITLVLGLVLGGMAVLALATRRVATWAAVVALVAAAIIVAIAIFDIVDVNRTAGDIRPLIDVTVGAGLWLTLIAGLAGIAGGVLMLVRRPRNR